MTAGRAHRPERYHGRHAVPTTRPLGSGWKGRAFALMAAVAVMVSLMMYFDGRAEAAAAKPKRHTAMNYVKAQRGDWYQYGATGPHRWDCSGLVMKAYRKAGIWLPRTTYQIQKHWRLQRVSFSKAKWGDIVFTSPGHVELYGHGGSRGWMVGAHRSGTRVSYKRIYSGARGYPRVYHVKGAG